MKGGQDRVYLVCLDEFVQFFERAEFDAGELFNFFLEGHGGDDPVANAMIAFYFLDDLPRLFIEADNSKFVLKSGGN